MAKKQTEIPGTERPSIPTLDEAVSGLLEAKAEAKRAAEAYRDANTLTLERMREVAEQLETDDHDNPCYVYRADNGKETAVKLSSSTKLVTEVILDPAEAEG